MLLVSTVVAASSLCVVAFLFYICVWRGRVLLFCFFAVVPPRLATGGRDSIDRHVPVSKSHKGKLAGFTGDDERRW